MRKLASPDQSSEPRTRKNYRVRALSETNAFEWREFPALGAAERHALSLVQMGCYTSIEIEEITVTYSFRLMKKVAGS